jgi:hypothetical protein
MRKQIQLLAENFYLHLEVKQSMGMKGPAP